MKADVTANTDSITNSRGEVTAAMKAPRLQRRAVLQSIAGTTAAALGLHSVEPVQGQPAFRLVQGGDCTAITPLSGDEPVEEFYRYDEGRTYWSAEGPIDSLTEPRTSRLFLYQGPNGLSLVVVHGARQDGDLVGGGSVSFTVRGLPADGEWVVQDDLYDGPKQFDEWNLDSNPAIIHWTWGGGKTDGAAFRGLDGARIVIDPAFNEEAELYEQYYTGDVERWQAVTDGSDGLELVDLDLDQRLVLGAGSC
jgi:hypothetical protein